MYIIELMRKTKNNNKMKEDLRLFLPTHTERHESIMKKKVRTFIVGCGLLQNFLSMGTNPDDEENLEFYSDLYKGMEPLLTEITCYLISIGYLSRRKRIDNSISLSQKILGLLKILHLRYVISITSQNPTSDTRWYQESDKTSEEIVKEISILIEKMYSFP
jgi:hypothetical protein